MRRRSFLQSTAAAGAIAIAAGATGCSTLIPRALADFDVGGRIAYVAGNDISVWSNGASTKLTKDGRWEGPNWSPDGTQVVASWMSENYSEIMILDTSGNRVRQLTKDFSNVSIARQSWGRKPMWSPDGTRVAYISDNGSVADAGYKLIDMSLFVVDADGKNLKKYVVPYFFTGGVDWPTWSPDGKQIAYERFETSKTSQLHVYKIASDSERQLGTFPEGAYDPAWSPDGQWIAFTARSQGKHDVYVLPAAGGQPTKLTTSGANLAPTWSPDGSLLAYINQTEDVAADIWVLKLGLSSGLSVEGTKQLTQGLPVKTTSGLSWTS